MYLPNMDDMVKEQIMDALRGRNQGENIIGLCGSVKRVKHSTETAIRRAERDQLFQNIVTATVTKKPNITKIQTQIGDAIGLNFDDQMNLAESTSCMCFGNNKRMTTAQRALLLCAKMKELQTVLVVLYDLHGRLNLGEIGIPFGEDHNGCKILLTSTSVEVLSEQMKEGRKVKHSPFAAKEALDSESEQVLLAAQFQLVNQSGIIIINMSMYKPAIQFYRNITTTTIGPEFIESSAASLILKALRSGDRKKASHLLLDFGHTSHSLSSANDFVNIFKYCVQSPDPLFAMEIWRLMELKGISIDNTCSSLMMRALCKGVYTEEAFSIMDFLGESRRFFYPVLPLYNSILSSCTKNQNFIQATKCLDLMKKQMMGTSEVTYTALLKF
ncbi:pentatricopeptide repeat-containing protein at1g76280-like protein [Trifolium pratense]|uniref:Pentatricopeptide repeat-containing protein at1g76280-like protein n=1 Tax=Trifolium pratense TaxID=57577 RepID=A0A2K3PKF5_TRIPR|nr:pentatricopeptide repeat-containing protein at1g76280-like protein [Trifolium pratense]